MELGSSSTAQQEEETSANSSARGQTLSPQRGQPGWRLCNTLKANTGPCHAPADESWRSRGCIQPAASRRGRAAIRLPSAWHSTAGRRQRGPSTAVAAAVGNTYGLLPGSCLHQAPRSFPGKMEPLCPGPGPFLGRARRMPPGPVMSRQEGDCFGGSWVSGSTCPAPGPSTMAAFLRNCCRAANYPPLLIRDAK